MVDFINNGREKGMNPIEALLDAVLKLLKNVII